MVTVDRKAIVKTRDRDILLAKLAPVLGLPIDTLHARGTTSATRRSSRSHLRKMCPIDGRARRRAARSDFPGVQAKEVALRVYPYGSRAAHVLGYVGAINDTEYKTLKNDGYTLEDQVGKDGVEKIFEKDLRGTPGSITLEVDSTGRVLRELAAHRPRSLGATCSSPSTFGCRRWQRTRSPLHC